MHSILISGAGVAGPTLAYWIGRAGFDTLVVERAAAPRQGGQAIDIRGRALEVVDAMGLSAEVERKRTRYRGMSILNEEGEETSRTALRTMTGGAFESGDIELFRDDAAEILMRATGPQTAYRFGDGLVGLEPAEDGVVARFVNSAVRRFDLAVGADGYNSIVRRLAFAQEGNAVKSLGLAYGVFTLPNVLGLENWQLGYRGPRRGFVAYPTLDGADLRANFVFPMDEEGLLTEDAARSQILHAFGNLGGVFARVLEHLPSARNFYAAPLVLVAMPKWSNGRIAVIGDAAYCPSPFTGQGTSLAIVGAFVLATELARTPDDHEAAFVRYEQRMRPFVATNQAMIDVDSGRPVPDDVMRYARNAIKLDDLFEYWGD